MTDKTSLWATPLRDDDEQVPVSAQADRPSPWAAALRADPNLTEEPASAPDTDPMPVFVLKGKDALAPGIIDAYRREAARHGLDEHAEQVSFAFVEMAGWQKRHPELVKLPDHEHVSAEDQARAAAGQPRRDDVVAAWLERERDRHPLFAEVAAWNVVDDLLKLYRRHADTGTSLDQEVPSLHPEPEPAAIIAARDIEPKLVRLADREGDEWRRASSSLWRMVGVDLPVAAIDDDLVARYGPLTPLEYAGARAPSQPAEPDDDEEPVHTWFGLSYATHAVVPRTLAQSMPVQWQRRFVAVLEEVYAAFAHIDLPAVYRVEAARESTYGDLYASEMARLNITRNRDAGGGEVFHDFDGTEHSRHDRVLVPVADPVPHYNRGRTFIAPGPHPQDAPVELSDAERSALRRLLGDYTRPPVMTATWLLLRNRGLAEHVETADRGDWALTDAGRAALEDLARSDADAPGEVDR